MKGFEGPENGINIDFENGEHEPLEIIRDEPQPESAPMEVFSIEEARKESPFELLGRMGVIQQEISRLRDSIANLPPSMHAAAKEEMGFLVKTYNQLDTLYNLKQ